LVLSLATAFFAFVGCGGSTTTSNTTPDGAPPDASGDDASSDAPSSDAPPPSDGGCISPFIGEACAPGQMACQPHDPCCAGYEWVCDGTTNTWQQAGLGCACQIPTDGGADADSAVPTEAGRIDAGSFLCGTMTCTSSQFCEDIPPGTPTPDGGPPPDAFVCMAIPNQCASTPTCGCIEASIQPGTECSNVPGGATCMADGAGHVTIHCLGQ
jgi:hypothetical protein